jgi:hypothetical protein
MSAGLTYKMATLTKNDTFWINVVFPRNLSVMKLSIMLSLVYVQLVTCSIVVAIVLYSSGTWSVPLREELTL